MVRNGWTGALAVLALAGCAFVPAPVPVQPPVTTPSFAAALETREPAATPGACWHRMGRPALFETVTEQVQVTPEQRDAAGVVTRPAVFRTETRQSELRPRQQVWFRIPCRADVGSELAFTASLQRALKARGLYGGAVNGEMDPATEAAILRFQAANGLDSTVLSLAAAQALGLMAVGG